MHSPAPVITPLRSPRQCQDRLRKQRLEQSRHLEPRSRPHGRAGRQRAHRPDESALLTSGDFSLLTGAHFSLEIGGVGIGTEHDAIKVEGTVTRAGDLFGSALIGSWSGSPGDIIYVILNDGTEPVSGSFFDGTLPILEGETLAIDGVRFAVHYAANADGGAVENDVSLVRTVPEPGALLLILAGLGFAFKRRR